MKRIAAFVLILVSLAGVFASAEETTLSMMGFEYEENNRDWATNAFFPRMAEQTGVSFTFDLYRDQADYAKALEAAFENGGALPDVLFKADLSPEQEMRWLENGTLIDLAPYLAEYAPNLYAILEARPDWRAIITQPNGAIASLPVLNGAERECCVWLNKTWMDALGREMPETIDAFTDLLRAFRDGDPNANGKKDEIPLSLLGAFEAKFLLHAWGIIADDYNVFVRDGEVVFAPFESGYRDFVTWLAGAMEEGLIEKDAFRQSQATRTNSLAEAKETTLGALISIAPYTLVNLDDTVHYVALTPLAHEGTRAYRRLLTGVGRGAFAVTSACADIGAALRWVDALYTEAGGRLAFAGLEGEDYTLLPDGTWKWTAGEDYYALTEIVATRLIASDSRTPGLEPAAFMRNTEIVADNHARRQTDLLRSDLVYPYPVTWPTDAAREARIAELQEALGTAVDLAIAEFASGRRVPDDAGWQAFMDELDALGAAEFVSLLQAKLDEQAK